MRLFLRMMTPAVAAGLTTWQVAGLLIPRIGGLAAFIPSLAIGLGASWLVSWLWPKKKTPSRRAERLN